MTILTAALAFLAGIVVFLVGGRGRRVGDHPFCRGCGFDLFGKPPDGTRCPECGADLAGPRAARVGQRQPRRGLRAAGLLLCAMALAWGGKTGWDAARRVEWARHEPVRWLRADVDSPDAAGRDRALAELGRRLREGELSGPGAAALIDHALDVQADAARPWTPAWWGLIEAAASRGALTPAQAGRFLRQGFDTSLQVKPVLRRGQSATFHYESESNGRLCPQGQPCVGLAGGQSERVLRMDGVVLSRNLDLGAGSRSLGSRLSGPFRLDQPALSALPDGRHEMVVETDFDVTLKAPFRLGPVHFTKTAARGVELRARDAATDRFESDPARRESEAAAVREAVVDPAGADEGGVLVEVRAAPLPVPLAVEVVLARGGREQRVGPLVVGGEAGKADYWHPVGSRAKLDLPGDGPVDVWLRPSQEAVDSTRSLGTYWGEPLVLRGVPVGRPAGAAFVHDESLRRAVEASLDLRPLRWAAGGRDLEVALFTAGAGPPVLLNYDLLLRGGGKEVLLGGVRFEKGTRNYGVGYNDKPPAAGLERLDVVLRPRPDRGSRPADGPLPWGGEIVYHDVPLPATPAHPE